jgi:hypothetical protein
MAVSVLSGTMKDKVKDRRTDLLSAQLVSTFTI